MQVTTTAKIQLIVSDEQAKKLDDTMLAYRDACNYVSAYIFKKRTCSILIYTIITK